MVQYTMSQLLYLERAPGVRDQLRGLAARATVAHLDHGADLKARKRA